MDDKNLDLDKMIEAVGKAVLNAATGQLPFDVAHSATIAAAFRDFATGYAMILGTAPEVPNAGG